MALIEKPAEIIKHIITEEVGASVNTSSYSAIDSLENKLAFTVHDKQVNSKKLIEEIASNTRVIPYFKNNFLLFYLSHQLNCCQLILSQISSKWANIVK